MKSVARWVGCMALCWVAALSFTSPAWAATAADSACAQADAYRASELKKEAVKAYGKLAQTQQCARDALAEIKTEQEDADKKSAPQPKATEAKAHHSDLLKEVRALRAAGLDEQATEKLKAWAALYPGKTPPADLRPADRRADRWQDSLDEIGPTARSLAEVGVLGLAALALMLVGWRKLAYWPAWLRRRLVRGLRIETPEKQESLSAALADHLHQFKKSGAAGTAKMVGPTEVEFELPEKLVSAFAPVGLIASTINLLRQVWPRRVASLTLRPADPLRGLGVAVGLRGGPKAQMTFWEGDFDLAPDSPDDKSDDWRLQRLMLPVAAWLAYALDAPKSSEAPLGCEDWRSYAHFAVGAVFQRAGEASAADKQYRLALDRCPANRGARVNLAALRLATDPPHKRRAKLKPLRGDQILTMPTGSRYESLPALPPDDPQQLLDPLEEWSDELPEATLLWRARYLRAVTFAYRGRFRSAACDLRRLKDLLEDSADDPDTELLRRRLRRLARIFSASVLVEAPNEDLPWAGPTSPGAKWETAAGYYNLACYWSRRLGKLSDGTSDAAEEARDLALIFLANALRHASDTTKAAARKDPALQSLADDYAFATLTKPTPRPKVDPPPAPAASAA